MGANVGVGVGVGVGAGVGMGVGAQEHLVLRRAWNVACFARDPRLLKKDALEYEKTRPGPEFHSASIGAILSF